MQFTKQQLTIGAVALLLVVLIVAFGAKVGNAPVTPSEESFTATTSEDTSNASPDEVTPPTTSATKPATGSSAAVNTPTSNAGRMAPELVRPTGFSNINTLNMANTNEFKLADFVGKKVVLLEFWTTSSMNAMRTMPYLSDWSTRYKDAGLVVIGVHTPQFQFEKYKNNVDLVATANHMLFPLVIDNEYNTWNAYKNTKWPHLYLIDLNGKIVYDQSGEGAYQATQTKIESLLTARAKTLGLKAPAFEKFVEPKDAYPVDLTLTKSPELYFGAGRNKNITGGAAQKEGVQTFTPGATMPLLNWILPSGTWNFTKEYVEGMTEGASMSLRYSAKNVYATLSAQKTLRVKILIDGKPLDASNAGKDVRLENGESVIYAKDARIYDIVKGAGYGEHVITLTPAAGGLDIYTFMFG